MPVRTLPLRKKSQYLLAQPGPEDYNAVKLSTSLLRFFKRFFFAVLKLLDHLQKPALPTLETSL